MSRGVRCGIVSTPVNRSIATRRHDPAHPRARARVVVHVDELRLARVAHRARGRDQRLRVRAERRVELHGDDERRRRRAAAASCVGSLARRDAASPARARGRAASPTARRSRRSRRGSPRSAPGVVPQQPPMIAAPSARACAANSPKYAGVACGKTMRCPDMLARPTFGSAASGAPDVSHLRERARARPPGRRRGSRRRRRRRASRSRAAARARRDAGERLAGRCRSVISATIGSAETERTAATAVSRSSRSKNVSTMKRSTPRPSRIRACSA